MLTEKILFQNSSLAFYYHPRPRPPPSLAKDHIFSGFFFATFPKSLHRYLLDITHCEALPIHSSSDGSIRFSLFESHVAYSNYLQLQWCYGVWKVTRIKNTDSTSLQSQTYIHTYPFPNNFVNVTVFLVFKRSKVTS